MDRIKQTLKLLSNTSLEASDINNIIQYINSNNMTLDEYINSNKFIDKFTMNNEDIYRLIDIFYENNVKILTIENEYYPSNFKLNLLNNYPPILFSWGNISLLENQSKSMKIGIIGSRKNTTKGKEYTKIISSYCAKNNYIVVSGGAIGIDTYASKTAYESGGCIIIISSESIDKFLSKNPYLYELDRERILLLSEKIPLIPWDKKYALARNRLIASLSKKLIVIESNIKSGSLSTAFKMLKMRKAVYCINDEEINNLGNKLLLNKKAIAINSEEINENLSILLTDKNRNEEIFFTEFI